MAVAHLIVKLKDRVLQKQDIDISPFHIGRDPSSHLQIDNMGVSRTHAILDFRKNRFYVIDKGSSNGVYLNSSKIGREEPLRDGDTLQIAKYTIVFHWNGKPLLPQFEEATRVDVQLSSVLLDQMGVVQGQGALSRPADSAAPPPPPTYQPSAETVGKEAAEKTTALSIADLQPLLGGQKKAEASPQVRVKKAGPARPSQIKSTRKSIPNKESSGTGSFVFGLIFFICAAAGLVYLVLFSGLV